MGRRAIPQTGHGGRLAAGAESARVAIKVSSGQRLTTRRSLGRCSSVKGSRMSKAISVLIIEDSEDDALLLVRRLARSGFDPAWKRVETAESLRAALAEKTWDIAFSDHSMRGFGRWARKSFRNGG